jgi:hypothetical protein
MKPLNESGAGRWVHFLTEAVFHHPRWFYSIQLLLVMVCLGYTVTTLQFSTEKSDLISVKESYRRQFLEFKKEFNIHDNLFVFVESEDRQKNREFVERLAARIRVDGQFADVYYRGGLKLMGPKALLFLPEETLAELEQNVRSYRPLFQTYSQATNLNSLFALVNRQFRLLDTNHSEGLKEGKLLHRYRPYTRFWIKLPTASSHEKLLYPRISPRSWAVARKRIVTTFISHLIAVGFMS